jgi:spermidine synthase
MMRALERWLGGSALYRQGEVEVREKSGVRTLHLGSETIQSAMRVERPHDLELSYTRAMMAFLLFVPAPKRALMIGLGGGSLAKFVYFRLPQSRVHVVEVSAEVVKVARSHFLLPADDDRLTVEIGEGARYLSSSREEVDALLIDAYDGRSLAASLTTDVFYSAARNVLNGAGVLVMNLWSNDWAFDRNVQRIERAFDNRCICLPAERPGNVIALAFATVPQRLRWRELSETAIDLQARLGLPFPEFVAGLRKMNRHDSDGLCMDR